MKGFLIILFLLFIGFASQAQAFTVFGKVTDKNLA
jgi:hypothetical protein